MAPSNRSSGGSGFDSNKTRIVSTSDTWRLRHAIFEGGRYQPCPLEPERPLLAVSSAAVPGTTIHRTCARPTAIGTPPATGATTGDFRLARTPFAGAVGIMVPAGVHLTFTPVHDEHGWGRGGARYRSGACLGSLEADRRRWLSIRLSVPLPSARKRRIQLRWPLVTRMLGLGANRTTNYNMLSLSCEFLRPAPAQWFQRFG